MTVENIVGTDEGSFGLFQYQDPDGGDECIEIPEDAGDGWFRTAQVCSIISLCSGAILTFFGFCKQCCFQLPCSQLIMDLSSVLTQVTLALVYLVWGSTVCKDLYNCSWGQGQGLLVLTQIFWLAAGCFTRCMRDGRSERRKDDAGGD